MKTGFAGAAASAHDAAAPATAPRRAGPWRSLGLDDGDAVAAAPRRVHEAIRLEQQRSEVLIGRVQLALVLVFATLYAVSPKAFAADAAFQPVPWALGAYLVFTLARLWAARRIDLPPAILMLSIVVDFALLFGTIWSFHVQYQQPPAFYLKAPTVLYVFIFIVLRALRFETRYVLVSGLVAAAGWTLLLAYALLADPAGRPITRDYVSYMTSPSVLIGAEIDKIVAILVVTAVLVIGLSRARRLLAKAVAGETAARDLERFFAPEIARRITAAESTIRPGDGEQRVAALLFVDLRGFTTLAERMEPGAVIRLLSEYQARMVPIIQRHGGSIDKFLGDGIMASFGAASVCAAYAADAMRCVDELVASAEAWRQERAAAGLETPGIGAAIAVGDVLFGAVGDESRLEYTVIGDAVNLAAKLEKHTKVERVRALTTAAAYDLACTQGYVAPSPKPLREAARVAGVAQPIDIVVLAA